MSMFQRPIFLSARSHLARRCSPLPGFSPVARNPIATARLSTRPRPTTIHPQQPPQPQSRPRPFYTTPFFTIPTAFILGYVTYTFTTTSTIPYPINPYSFTPHVITSTTPLSPTSSLITLSPKQPSTPPPSFWAIINSEGLWSVQIKQPQLQIQREYTPLPETLVNGGAGDDQAAKGKGRRDRDVNPDNQLTIFVRAVDGGEVSPYLLSRKPGDVVEVRGPVVTYTFRPEEVSSEQEKDIRNVVFIAGGTGVSPAIQLTTYLLSQYTKDGKKRQVKILFASKTAGEKVLPQIQELQRLGDGSRGVQVSIEYFYDDKDTFIKKPDIETAVLGLDMGNGGGNGRDVIMVSGPEGFVNHFAGKKGWKDGLETQGVLGGVVGEILKSRKQGGKIEVMKL
ncbi:mitochondrial Homoaconitase [Orbilia javanica]|uniref:Mitochondrial Homoaconitase n=1 Tax=Orbilia javanica TaxID=47235 RepID=A0AAN8MQU4_9PEZI